MTRSSTRTVLIESAAPYSRTRLRRSQPLPTVKVLPAALRSGAVVSEGSSSSRKRASPHCNGGVTASERSMIVKLTLNALPTDVFEELLNFLRPALK